MSTKQKLGPVLRGDSVTIKVTFLTSAGLPINITGNTLWFTLKIKQGDPDPGVLQKAQVAPANADSVAGIGYITLQHTDTTVLVPRSYYYDIQWVQPGVPPWVETPLYGLFQIVADITRSVA